MKTNVRRFSKRAISLLLSVLMVVSMIAIGIVSTNAYNVYTSGYVYFDNTLTNWTDSYIMFIYGRNGGSGDHSKVVQMTKIANTNLYYCKPSDEWTGDVSYTAFIGASSLWGTGDWGSSNLRNATHYTNTYGTDISKDYYYLFTPSSSSNNTNLTVSASTSLQSTLGNNAQTLKMKVDDGSGYVDSTASGIATLSISSYWPSSYSAVTNSSTSGTSGSVKYDNAARSAKTTLSYTLSNSAYSFQGFYNSSGTRVSTTDNYAYNATSGSTTYYAYFQKTVVNSYTLTYSNPSNGTLTVKNSSGTTISSGTKVNEGTSLTATVTPSNGYKINTITVNGSSKSLSGNSATFTMPSSDTTVAATTTKITYRLMGCSGVLNAADNGGRTSNTKIYDFNSSAEFDSNNQIVVNLDERTGGDDWFDLIGSDGMLYVPSSNTQVDSSSVLGVAQSTTSATNNSTQPSNNFWFGSSGTYVVTLDDSSYPPKITVSKASKYKIVGSDKDIFGAQWATTYANGAAMAYSSAMGKYMYTIDATNSDIYFRFIDSSNNQYGCYDDHYNISSLNPTSKNGYGTTKYESGYDNKCFVLTKGSKYVVYIDEPTSDTGTPTVYVDVESELGTETSYYMLYHTVQNPSSWSNSNGGYVKVYIKDGVYTAYIDVEPSKTYYISAANGTNYTNVLWKDQTNSGNKPSVVYNGASGLLTNITGNDYYISSTNTSYKMAQFTTGAQTSRVIVTLNTVDTNTTGPNVVYTLNAETGTGASYVDLYAKDGTIRDTFQKYANLADTKIDTTNSVGISGSVTSSTYYEQCRIEKGGTIKLTTTIDSTNRSKYYVRAFCVNGETVGSINGGGSVNRTVASDGVYKFEYQIPSDFDDEFVEITPIYFYADSSGDYVTFYVEGFDSTIESVWGNTIAAYVYYYDCVNTTGATNQHALGGYPGQPMVMEGGRYYMQVPKTCNGKTIEGVTLNNYKWDEIHVKFSDVSENCQTYDYNDFVKLADKNSDNIVFSFRYKTKTDNDPSASNDGAGTYNATEKLTDYFKNEVDIFGGKVDSTKGRLLVVSQGYVNLNTIVGKYATEWYIYEQSGTNADAKYIGKILCSELLNDDVSSVTSTYQSVYRTLKSSYTGYGVDISYEKAITNTTDDIGNRSDGRWYYAQNNTEITSNILIEYETEKNTYIFEEDTFDATTPYQGATSGNQAYFANTEFDHQTEATTTLNADNYFELQAEPADNYVFDGWYLRVGSNSEGEGYSYTKINGNPASTPMDGENTYVARFVLRVTGQLTISHKLYSSVTDLNSYDPASNGGLGYTYLKVEVVNPTTGTVVATYGSSSNQSALTISSKYVYQDSPYKLNVTLYTVPRGDSTFPTDIYYFRRATTAGDGTNYAKLSDGYTFTEEAFNTTGKSAAMTVNIDNLFICTDETTQIYELATEQLRFYSDLISGNSSYKITYTYSTRLDGTKPYVVTGNLTDAEVEKYVSSGVLTQSFIESKAPYVDNFGQDINWNTSAATKTKNGTVYTAEVSATTTDKLKAALTVDYGSGATDGYTVTYGELATYANCGTSPTRDGATNDDYVADYYYYSGRDAENAPFLYWSIVDDSGKEIAQCYAEAFNYRVYGNYTIKAVTGSKGQTAYKSAIGASLTFLEYSRNQWTDDTGATKTDKLYVDFSAAFAYNHEKLNSLAADSKVRCGIAFEICGDMATPSSDQSAIAAVCGRENTSALGTAINSATGTGKVTYTAGNATSLYVYDIDKSQLNNKNRIEYYFRFSNTDGNRKKAIRFYAYIVDTDGNVYLSDPQYVNMSETGLAVAFPTT